MAKYTDKSKRFSDLKTDELRQLCYIGYFGEDFGSAIPTYVKHYCMSRAAYDEITHKLLQLGYLITHNTVSSELHLDLIDFMAVEHPDWVDTFKQIRRYSPTHICEYLWKLAALLRRGDFDGAQRLNKPYERFGKRPFNIYPYITGRAERDARYVRLLDDEQVGLMVSLTLEQMLDAGRLDEAVLDGVRQLVRTGHPRYGELVDRIALYDYFATGRLASAGGQSPTLWSLSLQAVCALYQGQVEQAVTLFSRAVATQGRRTGSLPVPVLNYLYAIAILRYRLKYGTTALRDEMTALRSSVIRTDGKHFAAQLLLDYAESAAGGGSTDIQQYAHKLMSHTDSHQDKCFALLMAHYFEMPHHVLSQLAGVMPRVAIMLHEASSYLIVPAATRQTLEQRFGGKPLLASIRRRAAWEVMLTELNTTMGRAQDTRPRRIAYFMDGMRLASIMEQVQGDDGSWTDKRLLSRKVMCTEGYDSMDLADSRIAMELSRQLPGQSDAAIVVPNLVDAGRIFFGPEYLRERTMASIVIKSPFVSFTGQGEKITITSNVKIDAHGMPCKHTVTIDGDTFVLVAINQLQRDILSRLLTMGELPASAAPSMKPTIESLRGIIQVNENILAHVQEHAIESDGVIVVRIEPEKHGYRITLLAAVLPQGTARLVPATGEEYAYDVDSDGHTHCVHRDMAREHDNFQGLVDVLSHMDAEFSDEHNVCVIGSERNLLNLLAYCHDHHARYVLEWPRGQMLKFKGVLTDGDIHIDVKTGVDWFEVMGQVTVGDVVIDMQPMLSQCCLQGFDNFVMIGEGEYVQMSETLKRHLAELDALLTMGDKRRHSVPKFHVGALAHTLEALHHSTDDGYRDLMLKMKQAYQEPMPVPETLNAALRPYQEEGYRWLRRLDAWGAGACLADDMGLGKTLQALAFILSKSHQGPSLVVAPKSVVLNWVSEVGKFAPSLALVVLNTVHNRTHVVSQASAGVLVLCTYGVLTTEAPLLSSLQWNVVCLDEAQQIKNRNTMVSRAAMGLQASSRIILTGTPVQNHLGELWNLMQFINPGILGPWSVFRDNYVITQLDQAHRDTLQEMTQPFILRRTKQQVLAHLPEKVETIHYVNMTDQEAEVYEAMRHRVEVKFKKNKTAHEKAMAALLDLGYFEELMKLRLVSCDMHLVYNKWREQSSKVTAMLEILDTLLAVPDNNVLVFSQFTSFLALVRQQLDAHGWDHYYLDGQTPMHKRQDMVDGFQQGLKRLFVSSLKAGGLGINLTAANYVILLDPWWNPAIEAQASDRAHRIGQKRCVSVIRLITQNSIEEKILRLHDTKRQISDDVLDGTSESYKLTYEDILDMVSPF